VRRLVLAAAIVILVVALVGRAVDAFSETTVDALAVTGLGLLAIGQALRVWAERSMRSVVILLLVLALGAFVLLD
jgi:protein-S-isoprenylcysteine O-methyltransferase Ste14